MSTVQGHPSNLLSNHFPDKCVHTSPTSLRGSLPRLGVPTVAAPDTGGSRTSPVPSSTQVSTCLDPPPPGVVLAPEVTSLRWSYVTGTSLPRPSAWEEEDGGDWRRPHPFTYTGCSPSHVDPLHLLSMGFRTRVVPPVHRWSEGARPLGQVLTGKEDPWLLFRVKRPGGTGGGDGTEDPREYESRLGRVLDFPGPETRPLCRHVSHSFRDGSTPKISSSLYVRLPTCVRIHTVPSSPTTPSVSTEGEVGGGRHQG